jgi:hypothetical protein
MILEEQAFSPSNDLAPPPPPNPSPVSKLDRRQTGRLRKRDNFMTGEWGMGRGRNQIIRQPESLVLCKSFNTLWYTPFVSHQQSLHAHAQPPRHKRLAGTRQTGRKLSLVCKIVRKSAKLSMTTSTYTVLPLIYFYGDV